MRLSSRCVVVNKIETLSHDRFPVEVTATPEDSDARQRPNVQHLEGQFAHNSKISLNSDNVRLS